MNASHLCKTWTINLVLILLSLEIGLCQTPTATITSIDGISHSTARINYLWQHGPLTASELIYSLSPAPCNNGIKQAATTPNNYSPWSMVLAGLQPATTYNVCVGLSSASGTTISPQVSFTTEALPSIHPATPIPPESFDSNYPDTSTYTKITTAADCSDLQTDINQALAEQAVHGTVISIPAGAVCTAVSHVYFNIRAADAIYFDTSRVRSGSPGLIVLPGHGLTEGQLLTFGYVYEYTSAFPTSHSCDFQNGLVPGSRYYAHVVDANTFGVYCPDGKTLMAFSDQGQGTKGFLLVPHFKVDGYCPTTFGPATPVHLLASEAELDHHSFEYAR